MKRRLFGLSLLAGLLTVALSACGGTETVVETVEVEKIVEVEVAPAPATAEWTFNHCSQIDKFHDQVFNFWGDKATAASGGRLAVDIQGASVLGYKCAEGLGAIGDGLVPVGEVIGGWTTSEIPMMNLETMPFMTTSYAEGNLLATIMSDMGHHDALAEKGVKPLFNYCFTGQHYWTKMPIKSLSDIANVKIRVYNQITSDMIQAVGASPVTIDMADLYTALQRGVVDGSVTSALTARDSNFHEVLSHGNAVYFAAPCTSVVAVNLDAWASTAGDLQAAALDAAEDARRYARIRVEDEEISLFTELESRGMSIVAPPPSVILELREKTAPMLSGFTAKHADAAAIVAKFNELKAAPG
jgi:TRAP-type C4-dicarboxylate transport system substrate-binding protein|tara:strand:+ start:1550 stop:2620 length:1071 start_codon:yes stop_codon:yes gene_type:complete